MVCICLLLLKSAILIFYYRQCVSTDESETLFEKSGTIDTLQIMFTVVLSMMTVYGYDYLVFWPSDASCKSSILLALALPVVHGLAFMLEMFPSLAYLKEAIKIGYVLAVLLYVAAFTLMNLSLLREVKWRTLVLMRRLQEPDAVISYEMRRLRYRSRLYRTASILVVGYWIVRLILACILSHKYLVDEPPSGELEGVQMVNDIVLLCGLCLLSSSVFDDLFARGIQEDDDDDI